MPYRKQYIFLLQIEETMYVEFPNFHPTFGAEIILYMCTYFGFRYKRGSEITACFHCPAMSVVFFEISRAF